MKKIKILDIPFDNVTKKEAPQLAFERIAHGIKTIVVTPNAEIAQMCEENEDVKRAVINADIILPDGEGIVLASKKLGTPLYEKVPGVEFGMDCVKLSAENGYSLFLLGGKEGVAEKAASELRFRFPEIKIAGTRNGYFNRISDENESVIKQINESGANILFVCLGAPAQEIWAHENKEKLSPCLICCLGGSLDIYSGNAKRAPKLFIKLRLEWFWRLLKEPTRLPRMMKLPKFLHTVNKHKKLQKRGKKC
jgi:N-acetylglucosaminyldiphosphoundecaprenol N-acetyl-beta-D-mannosaminyltransferase